MASELSRRTFLKSVAISPVCNAGHLLLAVYPPRVSGANEDCYVIAKPCIGKKDTACVDVCPVDCIHPRKDEADFKKVPQLYIDPVACIDCGACVPVCPVSAIFPIDSLPEEWQDFARINEEYYSKKHKHRAEVLVTGFPAEG